MTPEEIVNRAVADYEGWGPTPAWPTVGGWVVAMLESFALWGQATTDASKLADVVEKALQRSEDTAMSDDTEQPNDDLYVAWTIIANATYWDHTDVAGSAEWVEARNRWRDERFHPHLDRLAADGLPVQGEPQEATRAVSAVGGAPGVSETHTDPKEAP